MLEKKTLDKRCGAKLKTGKFEKWSKIKGQCYTTFWIVIYAVEQ